MRCQRQYHLLYPQPGAKRLQPPPAVAESRAVASPVNIRKLMPMVILMGFTWLATFQPSYLVPMMESPAVVMAAGGQAAPFVGI